MKIVYYPHPSLRHLAKPLMAIDNDVRRAAGEMLELMYAARGLGLAAPQVALPYQLLVMNFAGDPLNKDQECVAINPTIIERKNGYEEASEGCLSFPDLFQKVRRHKTVIVRAYDLEGHMFEMTAHDLAARIWQHEIDHLHGVLYIDKMSTLGKRAAKPWLEDFEEKYKRAQRKGEIPPDEQLERELIEREPKSTPAEASSN